MMVEYIVVDVDDDDDSLMSSVNQMQTLDKKKLSKFDFLQSIKNSFFLRKRKRRGKNDQSSTF